MDYEVRNIGAGWEGTDQTVDAIYSLVDSALTDPVVVSEARSIIRNVPERDKEAESRAISAYVRSHLRYTSETVETLNTPRAQVDEIRKYGKFVGDCDEAVTLWLALHRILGFQVRAQVISQRKDQQASHIYGQVFIKGKGWVSDDTIVKNKPRGWFPPLKYRTKTKDYGVRGLGGIDSDDEVKPMMSAYSPIRKMRSDVLTPGKSAWIGKSVASSGFRLKPSGMLSIDRAGTLSGIGVVPDLGEDVRNRVTVLRDAAGIYPINPRPSMGALNINNLVDSVRDIRVLDDVAGGWPIKPKPAPAAKPPVSSDVGLSLTAIAALAIGGWFLLKKKK